MLQSQSENVLIDLFEDLMIKSVTNPIISIEKKEIEEAIMEYKDGKTIKCGNRFNI